MLQLDRWNMLQVRPSHDVSRILIAGRAQYTGSIVISLLPNPWRSGREGCAPGRTPFSLASATVLSMMEKSLVERNEMCKTFRYLVHMKTDPAWKPQAMLAKCMVFISDSSSPCFVTYQYWCMQDSSYGRSLQLCIKSSPGWNLLVSQEVEHDELRTSPISQFKVAFNPIACCS